MAETVNHPEHYGGDTTYEVIKVLEAWRVLDFCLGNTIKYVARAGKKGEYLEDLRKAAWYLQRRIQQLTNAVAAPTETEAVKKVSLNSYKYERMNEGEYKGYVRISHPDGGTMIPPHLWDQIVAELGDSGTEEDRDIELNNLRHELMLLRDVVRDNYWRWQGDGEDHLESLSCPVIIDPQQLMRILDERR